MGIFCLVDLRAYCTFPDGTFEINRVLRPGRVDETGPIEPLRARVPQFDFPIASLCAALLDLITTSCPSSKTNTRERVRSRNTPTQHDKLDSVSRDEHLGQHIMNCTETITAEELVRLLLLLACHGYYIILGRCPVFCHCVSFLSLRLPPHSASVVGKSPS